MVLTDSEAKNGRFIVIGIFLLAVSSIILVNTFFPIIKEELSYRLAASRDSSQIIPVDQEFSIIIPKINANAKVIKDVDPFDSKIYQTALTQGVAHARGSSTPDQPGNIFIFAHSAENWYEANRFNAVFYLLPKLVKNDEIDIYFRRQKYIYRVVDTKLISGNEYQYISSLPGQNQLTLMTCWPPGTTFKRLIVIAFPQSVK